MEIINRHAFTVIYKKPFVDWVNSTPQPGNMKFTLKELNEDKKIYLFPSFEIPSEENCYLKEIMPEIFKIETSSLCLNENLLPKKITGNKINDWIELEVFDMVVNFEPTAFEGFEWDYDQ